jgi:chitodextrinase
VNFAANATDSDGRPMTYVWDFGDGSTGSGPAPTHTYALSGQYNVTVTATNDCGQTLGNTLALTILPLTCDVTRPAIKNPPTIAVTWVQNGLSFNFTGTATDPEDGVLTNVSWNFGDGSYGTGVNPTHAYAAPGAFFVTAQVTDKDGNCREAVVVVNPVVGSGSAGSGSLPSLACTMLRISANFAKANGDSLTMITQIVLPNGYKYANQPVTVQVGGLRVDGTLNAKGTYQDATHFIQLKQLNGYTLVELKIKNANIKASLGVAANANIAQVLTGVGVLTSVGGNTFIGNVDLVFSAVINGRATLKK